MTDDRFADLLRLAQAGDQKAAEALLLPHRVSVVRAIHAAMGAAVRRQAEAEDVWQDVVLRFLRKAGTLRRLAEPQHLKTWLIRAARQRVMDVGRRRRLRGESEIATDRIPGRGDRETGDVTRADDVARFRRLTESLLAPAQARVLWLFEIEKVTVDQIALEMGMTEAAVKKARSRARATLEERIGTLRRSMNGES